MKPSILLIYTGGTIGMMEDSRSGQLQPFDFSSLNVQIPELKKLDVNLHSHSFSNPMDSSDMKPATWIELTRIIAHRYDAFDGFVILHGSDTMAYTASALSFMLQNLGKPVVLTGSQLPIGMIRTDGKENIITAIEIASVAKRGLVPVPEVCIYFEFCLHRGNRTTKISASHFNAFHSGNYPLLAEAGVKIAYNQNAIRTMPTAPLQVFDKLDTSVAILKLFPGIGQPAVEAVVNHPEIKAIVLETFGSGNGPTDQWFVNSITKAVQSGKTIINISQCKNGSVDQGKYTTSAQFIRAGVISGRDMTTEAAVTKLMHVLGRGLKQNEIADAFSQNYCGEVTL